MFFKKTSVATIASLVAEVIYLFIYCYDLKLNFQFTHTMKQRRKKRKEKGKRSGLFSTVTNDSVSILIHIYLFIYCLIKPPVKHLMDMCFVYRSHVKILSAFRGGETLRLLICSLGSVCVHLHISYFNPLRFHRRILCTSSKSALRLEANLQGSILCNCVGRDCS